LLSCPPSRPGSANLLGTLGLRVSEACGGDIGDLDLGEERGNHVLRVVSKGGKPAAVPLPVPDTLPGSTEQKVPIRSGIQRGSQRSGQLQPVTRQHG
jgi:site-specific recombinase XerC